MHRHPRVASDVSARSVCDRTGRRCGSRYPLQTARSRIVANGTARYSGQGVCRQFVRQSCAWPSSSGGRSVGPSRRSASRPLYRSNRPGAAGRPSRCGLRKGSRIPSERQSGCACNCVRRGIGGTVQDSRVGPRRTCRGYVVRLGTWPGVCTYGRSSCGDRIARIGRAVDRRGGPTRGLQNSDRIGKVELR